MSILHRLSVGAFGFCLLALLPVWAPAQDTQPAGPAAIDIPESALKSGLLASHVEMVSKAVGHGLGQLREAGSDQEIVAARKGLLAVYSRYDSMRYQYAVAEEVAKGVPELLRLEDPRLQVNAALTVSQMRQVPIQPVLDAMLAHSNPAGRLYAWQGYRRIRLLVLAQGKEFAERMYASLAQAVAKENSLPVLQEALGMFHIESDAPRTISAQDFQQARKRLLGIFAGVWPRLCGKVAGGDLEMCACCRKGITVLRTVRDALASDSAVTQDVIGMVHGAMLSAAKALTAASPGSPAAAAVEPLLQDCENALNYVTRLRKTPMTSALATKGEVDRNLAVLSAVQAWRESLVAAGYTLSESSESQNQPATPSTSSAQP